MKFTHLRFEIKHAEEVRYYGHCQARPQLHLVSFERGSKDCMRIEEMLYEITKAQRDNHVLFEVKSGEHAFVLQFSDDDMWIGLGVDEHNWL